MEILDRVQLKRADYFLRKYISVGRVQGVGYRRFVYTAATELGITGTVRNLPAGTVETVAWGSAAQLASLATALKSGPPALASSSAVNRVEVETLSVENFKRHYPTATAIFTEFRILF